MRAGARRGRDGMGAVLSAYDVEHSTRRLGAAPTHIAVFTTPGGYIMPKVTTFHTLVGLIHPYTAPTLSLQPHQKDQEHVVQGFVLLVCHSSHLPTGCRRFAHCSTSNRCERFLGYVALLTVLLLSSMV